MGFWDPVKKELRDAGRELRTAFGYAALGALVLSPFVCVSMARTHEESALKENGDFNRAAACARKMDGGKECTEAEKQSRRRVNQHNSWLSDMLVYTALLGQQKH